ncbi:MAG: site-specific integrase, partial [Candidatus Sumerlaeota bacterium]|nr:site-specific integrase [Candidatus Sumerlaeota bacterium]
MPDAIARFDTFLRVERNLAPRTCVAYQYDLSQFRDWLRERNPELMALEAINPDDIRDFLAHLQSKHDYNASAMCRALSAIRQFFLFCVDRGFLEHSPADGVRNPKKTKKLPVFLIEGDLRRLLETTGSDDVKSLRDFCLLSLLSMTGVRLKELVGMNCGDVSLEGRTIRVMGKG